MSEGVLLSAAGLVHAGETAPKVERPGTVHTFLCRDGPDGARLREAHLAAHLAWVEPRWKRYAMAGPIRNAANEMVGSVFMILAEDAAEARALVDGDPYTRAGVYASIEALEITPAIGVWIGGKVW
jgi:uncharacterized protein YciI